MKKIISAVCVILALALATGCGDMTDVTSSSASGDAGYFTANTKLIKNSKYFIHL